MKMKKGGGPGKFVLLRRDEGGWLSLLGLLLALAIMAILAVILLGGPQSAGPGGRSGPGPLVAAKGEALKLACQNNLQQIRTAIQLREGNQEGKPASLQEIAQSVPGLQLKCPVGGEPYQYDPNTGRVWCIHPGHERL